MPVRTHARAIIVLHRAKRFVRWYTIYRYLRGLCGPHHWATPWSCQQLHHDRVPGTNGSSPSFAVCLDTSVTQSCPGDQCSATTSSSAQAAGQSTDRRDQYQYQRGHRAPCNGIHPINTSASQELHSTGTDTASIARCIKSSLVSGRVTLSLPPSNLRSQSSRYLHLYSTIIVDRAQYCTSTWPSDCW